MAPFGKTPPVLSIQSTPMTKLFFAAILLALAACKSDAPPATTEAPPVATEAPTTGPVTQISSASDQLAIDAVTGYIDPACQMKIAEDAPVRHTHEGVTYGFCSESCRERFKADPATYLAALEE